MDKKLIKVLEFVLNNVKDEGALDLKELAFLFNDEDNYMDALEKNAFELEKVKPESKDSFRYFLESEQMFFTKEVQGELIQLQSMGLITGKEIEQLIETAIFREFRLIDKEALRIMLPAIISNSEMSYKGNVVLGNNSVN